MGRGDVGVSGEGEGRAGSTDGADDATGNTCQRDIAGGDFLRVSSNKGTGWKSVPSEEAAVVREISSRAFSYTVEEDDIII